MATENKSKPAANNTKKRKQYIPHNKAVKKKGAYPLRPGLQGFFITCDGGRERQASHEAINVIDSFYEELVHGDDSAKVAKLPDKLLNKKIKFVYSDEEEEEDGDDDELEGEQEEEKGDEEEGGEKKDNSDANQNNGAKCDNPTDEKVEFPDAEKSCDGNQTEKNSNDNETKGKDLENQTDEVNEPSSKKQCIETRDSKSVDKKVDQKSIDKLIEDELKELGDKTKRRFINLDSGCNGVIVVQMRKIDGDPSPKDIVQHMMMTAASTKKHMSRFLLRVLPVEVSCYASEEEISRAMALIVEKYFPVDSQNPQKFAVLYEARANTGIDRMKIIDSVAKSVPEPHKVDLNNPDKTIVVEIVKTVCLIGLVEKYKELSKYNLRQLTSPK